MKSLRSILFQVSRLCGWSAVTVWLAPPCFGQGTFQVTFDGPPVQPIGTSYGFTNYSEFGMSFTPIDPNAPFAQFGRTRGGGQLAGSVPDNGTAYLDAAASDSLKFGLLSGSLFGVSSVDLAGYSGSLLDFNVHFVGYRPDGTTTTTNFSGTGLNFQTFYFGSEFSNLSRVEIPSVLWCLDNLVVAVPEPSGAALVLVGGLILALQSRGRGMRSVSGK